MSIRMRAAIVITVLAMTGIVGCGSNTATTAKPKTAQGVAEALKAKGLPLTVTVVYTETSPPKSELGRPGFYTSKVAFADSRIGADKTTGTEQGEVELGGQVEVFGDEQGAKTRAEYIQTIVKAAPIFSEYVYRAGPVVLRLSKYLTPDQAKQYETALASIAK